MSQPNPSTNNTNPAKTNLPTGASTAQKKDEKPSLIITINNKEEFQNYLQTTVNKHLLVEFYANWCGPCKIMAVKFQEIADKFQDKVIVLKVDVDDLEELAIEYDVTKMPSFMIMKDGKKLEQFFGNKPEQLDVVVEKYFGKQI